MVVTATEARRDKQPAGRANGSQSEILTPRRNSAVMREPAILKLDRGDEFHVEVDSDDLDDEEIVVRRTSDKGLPKLADRLAVIDRHLAKAERHPAGTTDRVLKADRERPY